MGDATRFPEPEDEGKPLAVADIVDCMIGVVAKQESDAPWPSERFLRQGVRANGWVMLSRVTLGYEIWRQLNGFPPVVAKDAAAAEGKTDEKKPKLKK